MNNHRSSNIPVEIRTAFAAVSALSKRFGLDRATSRAGLRCAARIDFNQFDTGAFSLVSKHRNDLRPRGVVDVLGVHPSRQALEVEVFDGDPPEPVDQITCEFVTEIPTTTADAVVIAGESCGTLAPALGPALASGDCSLPALQTLCGAFRPVRSGDDLTAGQCNEIGEAEVDADAIGPGAVLSLNLNMKDDIPPASLTGQDRALWLIGQFPVPLDLDLAGDSNKAELAGFADRHAVAHAKIGSMVASAGLKAREPGFVATLHAAKERLICLVETAKHLLLRGAGPAPLFRIVAANGRQRHDLLVASDRNALAIRLDAMLQRCIVEPTKVAQHLTKRSLLGAGGVDTEFVGKYHGFGSVLVVSGLIKSASLDCRPVARSHFVHRPNIISKRRAVAPGLNAGACAN